jgi:hypothetical protein
MLEARWVFAVFDDLRQEFAKAFEHVYAALARP